MACVFFLIFVFNSMPIIKLSFFTVNFGFCKIGLGHSNNQTLSHFKTTLSVCTYAQIYAMVKHKKCFLGICMKIPKHSCSNPNVQSYVISTLSLRFCMFYNKPLLLVRGHLVIGLCLMMDQLTLLF